MLSVTQRGAISRNKASAITPRIEVLRDGSATAYDNDEVWAEFSYQGTTGFTLSTIVNDRMTPLGTAADQTASSLDASGWTGEHASDNAFMKLESGSITPAEIGHLRARVLELEAAHEDASGAVLAERERLLPLTRCGCGDHFTAHDPGTCGACVAALTCRPGA
jgi:hypothetical protein